MTARAAIDLLANMGVSVRLDGPDVVFSGAECLTDLERLLLRDFKPGLVAALSTAAASGYEQKLECAPDDDAMRVADERLLAAAAPRQMSADFQPNPDDPFAVLYQRAADHVWGIKTDAWSARDWMRYLDQRSANIRALIRPGCPEPNCPAQSITTASLERHLRAAIDIDQDTAAELAQRLTAPHHLDFHGPRWAEAQAGAMRFIYDWGAEATRLGWTYIELFGMDSEAPYANIQKRGVAWLFEYGHVTSIEADMIRLESENGARQTYLPSMRRANGPNGIQQGSCACARGTTAWP